MTDDPIRRAAVHAATVAMESLTTNTIATQYVWRIVNAALDAYDHELAVELRDDVHKAWCIMADGKPAIVLPTKRIAREQRRAMAHLAGRPWRDYKIVETEVVAASWP